jgi:thiol-disulfide isomerase/thioredoxin
LKIVKEDKYNSIISEINKPTLILFTTINCPHCRTMEHLLRGLKDEKIIILKITSENKNLINNYSIKAFPTLLTFDKNKKPKEKLIGLKTNEILKKSIKDILE